MARHVEGYACEWKGVLDDPEKLSRFVSFVNAPDVADPTIEFTERSGRKVPIGMPKMPGQEPKHDSCSTTIQVLDGRVRATTT